jgi:hypothetical protein
LDDDRLSALEHDSALDYWEREGSDDYINSFLEDYGVTWDLVHTYPTPYNSWGYVEHWESNPNEVRIAGFNPKLLNLIEIGLRFTLEGLHAIITSGISQVELVALCNSHSHFTDDELGLPSESARLLREVASRNNPNQGKLF